MKRQFFTGQPTLKKSERNVLLLNIIDEVLVI